MRSNRPPRITAMWLAHHYPEDYDRCVVVGRSHVCRRCVVLYPIALVVLLLTMAWPPAGAVDVAVLVLLPLPALIELVLEQFGFVQYYPVRQMVVTVPLALALGRGFSLYFDDHTSRLFWGVVVGYSTVGFLAVMIGSRRPSR